MCVLWLFVVFVYGFYKMLKDLGNLGGGFGGGIGGGII